LIWKSKPHDQPFKPPKTPLLSLATVLLIGGIIAIGLYSAVSNLSALRWIYIIEPRALGRWHFGKVDLYLVVLLLPLPAARRGSVWATSCMLGLLGTYGLLTGALWCYWLYELWRAIMQYDVFNSPPPRPLLLLTANLVWIGLLCRLTWVARRDAIRLRRYRKKQCMQCKYDLTGNESGRCPECGLAQKHRGHLINTMEVEAHATFKSS